MLLDPKARGIVRLDATGNVKHHRSTSLTPPMARSTPR